MHKVVLESFEFAGGHRLILGRISFSHFNARGLILVSQNEINC